MKLNRVFAFLALSILTSNTVTASSPFEKYLKNMAILENENGHVLDTYEDIEGLNLNPFQERNKEYPIINESSIPEGYVKKEEAKKTFKLFSENSLLTDETISFTDFMNEHLVMEGAGTLIDSFPHQLSSSLNTPGSVAFNLRMNGDYRYVSRFKEYAPDALSCNVAPELCGDKCRRKNVTSKVKKHYYYDDDYLYSSESTETKKKKVHAFGANNLYSDFRNSVISRAHVEDGEEINIENSVVVKLKDRTPPYICEGYRLLGGTLEEYACTSNDWYKTDDLEVRDNDENLKAVSCKFSFGRLGSEFPEESEPWENYEHWDSDENIKIVNIKAQEVYHNPNGGKKVFNGFNDIVKFHAFDGVIRYSVFLREDAKEGNTNPGCEQILEDQPEVCYGYRKGPDLGTNPFTAQPWPIKDGVENFKAKGQDTGYIRVYDNDRPNIVIRVTEVETGKQMFFPPCLPAGEFKVTNSKKYRAVSGVGKTNEDDYNYFVKNLESEFDYSLINKHPDGVPFYTIHSLNGLELANGTDSLSLVVEKMLNNNDQKFINQNVRLEDYFTSDTLKSGDVTYSYNDDQLGKRRGTMKSMVAMFENSGIFVFKSGVEYQLDVWTDDNVKWTNIKFDPDNPSIAYNANGGVMGVSKPEILEYAKIYETGIKSGFIKLDIPDERENLSEEREIDISKSINGGINFVLKNSTPQIRKFNSVEEIENSGFPSITVSVKDFAGYTRDLKLFFRVDDRNLNVRVLEVNEKESKKKRIK